MGCSELGLLSRPLGGLLGRLLGSRLPQDRADEIISLSNRDFRLQRLHLSFKLHPSLRQLHRIDAPGLKSLLLLPLEPLPTYTLTRHY